MAPEPLINPMITCPTCGGNGQLASQRGLMSCSTCGGRGTLLSVAGRLFSWDRGFSTWQLLERKLERSIRFSLNGFLLLLGVGGFAALAKSVIDLTNAGTSLTSIVTIRNGLMRIVAMSILGDLYLAYRFMREAAASQRVPAHVYGQEEIPPSVDWDELRQTTKAVTDCSPAFSNSALSIVDAAWLLAGKLRVGLLEPLHLLATSLASTDVQVVMGRLGIGAKAVKERLAKSLRVGEEGEAVELSANGRRALLAAYAHAYERRGSRVEPDDLLVGLASFENPAQELLFDLGVDGQKLRNVVAWIDIQRRMRTQLSRWQSKAAQKPKGVMNRAMTAVATPALDRVSHDLTQLARAGALIPVVDRENEIAALFRLLEGGRSVLLVGNPGVGKTAIVEGLAARMASEEVPEVLQDKRLVSLSVARLVGSAGRPGELEERVLEIMNEIARAGNIVLVIDNVQNLVGLSTEGARALDVADLLTQLLGRGLLLSIAMTNPADYRRYVEGSSLVSSFSTLRIEEVDEQGAILILESKAPFIEAKYNVFMSYDALVKVVQFAIRYLHERYLPEKAIELFEEVAVGVRKRRGKGAVVSAEDVAELVAEKTNVPVTQLTEAESEKLLTLETTMHERIVGQDEAVRAVSSALRRARAELRDVKRPIASFLFIGPTGVGKTELAKTVAEVYFGREDRMIRLDMSEYQDAASLYRLLGAPAGSGGSPGGYLTEAVRKQPFALLLLDELEKAHPDILNVFLQVMDDGRLTDGTGRTIDFTNVIIIATSNAGTQFIQEGVKTNVPLEVIKRQMLEEILFRSFRPEFLNRFDDIILFRPLTFDEIIAIAKLLLKKDASRLAEKGISLRVTDEAVEELARAGFDPLYGARPLRRAIQERVDNALATFLLRGRLGRRDVAVLEPGGVIRVESAKAV